MAIDRVLTVLLAALWLSACGLVQSPGTDDDAAVRRAFVVLKSARAATLYSLEPVPEAQSGAPRLHSYDVLGSVRLKAAATVRASNAILGELEPSDWIAACFNPRQALRVVADDHVFDYVVCDECGRVRFYRDGKIVGEESYRGRSPVLKRLLTEAGIRQSTSDVDMWKRAP
ncbi:hypothetical protein [Phenylobacterium sp.]|uniref:hypothetical protein n=1 Tax=Phenylobacterium sp. TaxID=1871053 RepID=UPI0035B3E6CA